MLNETINGCSFNDKKTKRPAKFHQLILSTSNPKGEIVFISIDPKNKQSVYIQLLHAPRN